MLFPFRDDNPTRITPVLTIAIIAINVLVFLYQLSLPGRAGQLFVYRFGMIPAVLFGAADLPPELAAVPSWATVLTSMFLHGGIMHIAGNMLFLWVFGDNVEDAMGHVRFLAFYLLCGIAAGLSHAVAFPQSEAVLIGASGAVAGTLAAYLVLHPKVKLWVLVLGRFPLRISAMWMIGAWIAFQVFNIFVALDESTAWWAHFGGFATGAVLVMLFRRPDVPLLDRGLAQR